VKPIKPFDLLTACSAAQLKYRGYSFQQNNRPENNHRLSYCHFLKKYQLLSFARNRRLIGFSLCFADHDKNRKSFLWMIYPG
jgi:hypothetical protein